MSSIFHCEVDSHGDCPFCIGVDCRHCGSEEREYCNHDTLTRHLFPGEVFAYSRFIRALGSQDRRTVSYKTGEPSMSQTLGKTPKRSSNVRIEFDEQTKLWSFHLSLHGEWLVSIKGYKSNLDAETAAFRLSRKLNLTLRGL